MLRLVAVLGAAACLLVVLGVAAPSPAQAYVGQTIVEGAGGALSSGAEDLVKSGDLVPEVVHDAGVWGGDAAESGALGPFESAGLFPLVGTVVAGFSAGWEIGAQICGLLGESGCTTIHGLVGSSGPGALGGATGGKWVFSAAAKLGGPPYAFYWAYAPGTTIFEKPIGTVTVEGTECVYWTAPADASRKLTAGIEEGSCHSFPVELQQYGYVRYAMKGLTVEHSGSDSAGVPNLAFTPGSNWQGKEGLTKALRETPEGEKVGQAIAHRLSPATVPDPYATEGVVPNCGGLTYEQCASLLEFQGLEPVKNTLGWQTAGLGTPAERVVRTEPAAGTQLGVKSAVTVDVNPEAGLMPVLVPEWEPHETYQHYAARLPAALVPHKQEVGEVNEDAEAGPEAVLSTEPAPGSRADPSGQTDVNVRTNPVTAPAPGAGTGTCNAGVSAIDWSPLNKPLGSKFPFGVFGFFAGWLSSWESGSAAAPDWTFTVLPAGVFGSPDGLHVHVDLAFMAPVVSVARVVFLFAAFVGLLWFLATAAAKLQGDAS